MEITIKLNGQAVSVAVTVEVYEYLDQADHKDENLAHEQRRYWDMRELDAYIIANECSRSYILTPEQIACRKEALAEIMAVLNACTEQQRQRFFLYALEGMSYAEIGRHCGCSKYAVRDSITAVRKKYQEFLQSRPPRNAVFGLNSEGIFFPIIIPRGTDDFSPVLFALGGLANGDYQSKKVLLPHLQKGHLY